MDNYVITLGRQFGSLGRAIAHETADLLSIQYYDRDIVEEVAKRMKQPVKVISQVEEEAKSRFGVFGKMLFPLGDGTRELQDRTFFVQECVLRDFADRGPCILVGRCADYVLQGRENLLRVFIYAPKEARIRNCVEQLHMDREQAYKMCADVDRARARYHERYAGYPVMDPEHFDVMMNSDLLGVSGTAAALADLARRKFHLPDPSAKEL